MIKLDVCEYCQNCLEFEPVVTNFPELLYADGLLLSVVGDTVIKCKNHYKCETLYNNLKKENNNDQN